MINLETVFLSAQNFASFWRKRTLFSWLAHSPSKPAPLRDVIQRRFLPAFAHVPFGFCSKDLFPGLEVPSNDYGEFSVALEEQLDKHGLQKVRAWEKLRSVKRLPLGAKACSFHPESLNVP